MSLFSNFSATNQSLFRGLARNTRSAAKNMKRQHKRLQDFFQDEEEEVLDHALDRRIRKDADRMRRQGIDPDD